MVVIGAARLTLQRPGFSTLKHTTELTIGCSAQGSAAVVDIEVAIGIDYRITVIDATGAHARARPAGGVHAHAGTTSHNHHE